MNKRLWKLLQLNVIYTNGKVAANKRGRTQSLNMAFYTMLASLPFSLVLALFLGFVTYFQWKLVPELFFVQSGNMMLMTFGLTMFYSFSTFFKSRDFEQYLYYPYTKTEVFYGKLFAIFFMFSAFLLLIGAFGFSFGLATGGIVAAILQFVVSVMLGLFSFLLTVSFVFYVGTHQFLKKFGSILMGFGMIVFLLTMVIFSMSSGMLVGNSAAGGEEALFQSNIEQIPVLNTYYHVVQTQPLLLLLMIGFVSALCVGLFLLIRRRALSKYLQNVFSDATKTKKVKMNFKQKSPEKALMQHNINIVTSNKQYVLMYIYIQVIPVVAFIFPILGFGGFGGDVFQTPSGVAVFMLFGVALVAMSNMYAISENLYSLERENLDYMLSLPLSRKRIFKSKQRFALAVTMMPLITYTVVLSFVLQVHIVNAIVMLISVMIFNYIYQTYYLLRDEKSPNVNWSSEMDLLQGGMQTFLRVMRFYGMIILFVILNTVFFFTTQFWIIESVIVFIFYSVLLYLLYRYKQRRYL